VAGFQKFSNKTTSASEMHVTMLSLMPTLLWMVVFVLFFKPQSILLLYVW